MLAFNVAGNYLTVPPTGAVPTFAITKPERATNRRRG